MGTGKNILAEQWIDQSRELLKTLKELGSRKGDRLELVNDMMFALNSIDRSIHGWRSWIQNLEYMSKFSGDELREMRDGLLKESEGFIQFDTQVSEKHKDKFPGMPVMRRPRGEGRAGVV